MILNFRNVTRSLRVFTAMALCFSFAVIQPNTSLNTVSAQTPRPNPITQRIFDKFKSKEIAYKSAAGRYDQSIRGFAAVENMQIRTESDAKSALAALQNNASGLKNAYDKMVSIALNSSSLKSGVEAEADRVTPKTMFLQLRRSPKSFATLRGVTDAKNAIKNQFDADSAMLRRLGEKLQAAGRRSSLLQPPATDTHTSLIAQSAYRPQYGADGATFRLVKTSNVSSGAGEPVMFQTGVEIAVIAAISVILAAYAARKAADFTEPEDPDNEEDTRSRFRVCMDEAEATRDRCLRTSDFFGDLLCWGKFNAEVGRCLLLPL